MRGTAVAAVLAATTLAVLAMPASAGTTQISGTGAFDDCVPPPSAGAPTNPPNFYPPIKMAGDLVGCWYTNVPARSKFNPSGTYQEKGTELFVGCMGEACGTFSTTYTFTGKYVDDTFAEEIHGRCQHPIVSGTGDFVGAKGVVLFKDDVVNLEFNYRGHISLG